MRTRTRTSGNSFLDVVWREIRPGNIQHVLDLHLMRWARVARAWGDRQLKAKDLEASKLSLSWKALSPCQPDHLVGRDGTPPLIHKTWRWFMFMNTGVAFEKQNSIFWSVYWLTRVANSLPTVCTHGSFQHLKVETSAELQNLTLSNALALLLCQLLLSI